MLHVAELEGLLLEALLAAEKLLGLLVKLLLHVIQLSVEGGDVLLELLDGAVLGEQLFLVIGNIIQKNSLIGEFRILVICDSLEALDQFLLITVEVLDKRLQPLNLLAECLVAELTVAQVLTGCGELVALSRELLAQLLILGLGIIELDLLLVAAMLSLHSGGGAVVQLLL